MIKVLCLTLLMFVVYNQTCESLIADCIQCQTVDNNGTTEYTCITCYGWKEVSLDDIPVCILSVRLIVVVILAVFLVVGVIICATTKIIDCLKERNQIPSNIQSVKSAYQASQQEISSLNEIAWKKGDTKLDGSLLCGLCSKKGGTMTLDFGGSQSNAYHGDCAVWKMDGKNTFENRVVSLSRIHCLRCMQSYVECDPKLYVQFKKRKSRICPTCLAQ